MCARKSALLIIRIALFSNVKCLLAYVMLVFNDTSLCSRTSGQESQRSDNISFNAAVGNQQVQSSGVVYVFLPATEYGLVHEVEQIVNLSLPQHMLYSAVR